jgi:formate--tetrahydrofolate ligase
VKAHGVTPVVAINAFPTDHPSEHEVIRRVAESMGVRAEVCTNVVDGGAGATELARPSSRRARSRAASGSSTTRTIR